MRNTKERRLTALDQAAQKYALDQDTGLLYNINTGKAYENTSKNGQILLWTKDRYVTGQQVVWYQETGLDPNDRGARIIHMDGNPINNRGSNLRRMLDVMVNRAGYGDNPYAGVTLDKKRGLYFAQYKNNGKSIRVPGLFETQYEAKVARDEAIQELMDELYSDFPTSIEEANQ